MATKELNPEARSTVHHNADVHAHFEDYLKKNGYRLTKQRLAILDAILALGEHVDAENILKKAKTIDPSVGIATVYRTLQVMTESGILSECAFREDRSVFEISQKGKHHHDHLICMGCQSIVEFNDEELEDLQKKIAERLGFELTDHKVVLYGKCLDKKKCKQRKTQQNI